MQQKKHINDELRSELIVIGAEVEYDIPNEIDRVALYIKQTPNIKLRDIAYTTVLEARTKQAKIAIVATSIKDLLDKFEMAKRRIESGKRSHAFTKGVYVGTDMCPAPGRTVFLFPGEGSQYPDMIRDLTLHFPACRAAFDAADTAVASSTLDLGTSKKNILLPSRWIFPMSETSMTETLGTAQTIQGVMAADTALHFLFRQLGLIPDAVMGVGVGEIIALECAGAINLPEKRNRITMLGEGFRLISDVTTNEKIVPNCVNLSAICSDRERLEEILSPFEGHAIIACDQTPELFTISVETAVAEKVEATLSEESITFRHLPSVKKPFHTKKMEPYAKRFLEYYSSTINCEPAIPVYSCKTADKISGTKDDIIQTAAEQWLNPLYISKTIEKLYEDGYRVFVELGARGVLTTCVAATLRHKPHLALAANRGHRPDMLQFHHTLAALVSHGAELDISQLHRGRNSVKLDFDHPGVSPADQRVKRIALPRTLPSFSDADLPVGLIAPAPQSQLAVSQTVCGDSPGRLDFPCLNYAEIVRFTPEERIDVTLNISINDFPYLLDRALSAGATSAFNKNARGLLLIPIEILLEIMAETARKLYPEKIVYAIEKLQTKGHHTFAGDAPTVKIQAQKSTKRQPKGIIAIDVIAQKQPSSTSNASEELANCTIYLSDSYPQSPAPSPISLKNPIRVDWKDYDLYPDRLYSGESCRAIKAIPELGENGLRAECILPPRSGIIRASAAPCFSVSPIILVAISDILAARHSLEPANGLLHIPETCERIEFFAPPQTEWSPFEVNLQANPLKPDATHANASAEVTDQDHRVIAKLTECKNRVIHIQPEFHRELLHPLAEFFATDVPKTSMPTLPHEVFCCKIGKFNTADDDEDIRMKIAAYLTLSPLELDKWNDLANLSLSRRQEWLHGRIAAKDAVRKCLLARYGRKLGASDIRIESDEAGKPSPQGMWRKHCGAQMDISITHTPGFAIAAAAPNASLGIDIEIRGRTISEEFASSAFSQLEQEIAAESGDGETTLFRFWCAKEALSKALGTGLRYGPRDLCARAFDQTTGKVEMEATKLWLNPFPHLRGKHIDVQTCLVDDVILALAVLNPLMAKSETGPFLRLS